MSEFGPEVMTLRGSGRTRQNLERRMFQAFLTCSNEAEPADCLCCRRTFEQERELRFCPVATLQLLFPRPGRGDSLLCGNLQVDGARSEEFGGQRGANGDEVRRIRQRVCLDEDVLYGVERRLHYDLGTGQSFRPVMSIGGDS